ncbi:hypothetical protein E1B28_013646 [Marasmius oreades]|uniref:Mitochondrial ATPase inhibitor n=1 Tax=Marasmius oreades TaxID=181124 RepID=A0A9P7RQ77_9AGAR|nr:uncharacterized protein E1B28_013646 [Marasmius oreades]KAG7087699.1 hypothetical protein E1B28_013646 [Marasmius oreades]
MFVARITAARRLPQVVLTPKRFSSSYKEGSVAQSKGFKDKESAHENEYIHKQELLKLKAMVEQQKAELEKLKQETQDLKNKK